MKINKEFFIDIAETLVTSIFVLSMIYLFLAFPEVVYGASMEPNFYTGERILVEKVTKHFKKFERGEIIVLHPPGNDSVDYIKRIVGIPGDSIKIKDCSVFISRDGDKFKLEETYLEKNTCTSTTGALREGRSEKIGDNLYFVMGDNRIRSADSRIFGEIDKERIVGRVVFRFWPLNKLRLI